VTTVDIPYLGLGLGDDVGFAIRGHFVDGSLFHASATGVVQ
jgi:hypothetical protein